MFRGIWVQKVPQENNKRTDAVPVRQVAELKTSPGVTMQCGAVSEIRHSPTFPLEVRNLKCPCHPHGNLDLLSREAACDPHGNRADVWLRLSLRVLTWRLEGRWLRHFILSLWGRDDLQFIGSRRRKGQETAVRWAPSIYCPARSVCRLGNVREAGASQLVGFFSLIMKSRHKFIPQKLKKTGSPLSVMSSK